MKSILIVLVMVSNVYAAKDIVVKLGADTKSYKSKLIKLEKDLKVIAGKLNNLDNRLAIPSHAAGEVNKLERALKRSSEISKVTEIIPNLKDKGQNFRNSIQEILPEVTKAREVTDEVSVELVALHKKVRETKSNVKEIKTKVSGLIKKDIPNFLSGMTETQDCVYKADQTKRECMQDELNSGADDLDGFIKDSNKEVLALDKTAMNLNQKISNLQKVLKNIHSLIKPVQKLEYKVNKTIVPYLNLYKLMNKDYEVKFAKPNPYKPKKNNSFYMKVAGKEIIIGVLQTMDRIEKKLKGELLAQANKASVKKLAQTLKKKLDKDIKKVMKQLNLKINFKIKNLSSLHKIESTLVEPLEEIVAITKEVKFEVMPPQAVACKTLTEECN